MSITIDQESMVFLPTGDPNIMEVKLDYTRDDLQSSLAIKDWAASWKSVTLLWNRNAPAKDFLGAVQDAIAGQRQEKTEQKTVKTSLIAATGQCKKVTRTDPGAKPAAIPGHSAENPLYVRGV